MRTATSLTLVAATLCILSVGCTGPDKKLGRGLRDATEFVQMGQLRRCVEQTAIWDGPDIGYTTGFVRGMDLSLARTLRGAYEIATFPVPPYGPICTNVISAEPVYPDNYLPGLLADPTFGTDSNLGFSGGDVFPFSPGSRFRIFNF
ncbi:MAG: exosortase system-associated protein, TIGR04073 family [Candidatus Omnitrophica bacterium]|nr:exosortase system-associated protein, TIGR04073 family [Candidatus Omnitrophota bacterium]